VVLHPEYVDGKYAFYTRPQDSFIEAGKGRWDSAVALAADIERAVIHEKRSSTRSAITPSKRSKNGAWATGTSQDGG